MRKQIPARVPLLAGAILLSLTLPSGAQSPPTTAAPPASGGNTVRDPKACAPSQQLTPPQAREPGATTGNSKQNLGDRLAQTDGVLCPPPGIDPEIHAPTPNTGTMPVIPPPGSPGGDPTVRPK